MCETCRNQFKDENQLKHLENQQCVLQSADSLQT